MYFVIQFYQKTKKSFLKNRLYNDFELFNNIYILLSCFIFSSRVWKLFFKNFFNKEKNLNFGYQGLFGIFFSYNIFLF